MAGRGEAYRVCFIDQANDRITRKSFTLTFRALAILTSTSIDGITRLLCLDIIPNTMVL
jgi:hypothetical protein